MKELTKAANNVESAGKKKLLNSKEEIASTALTESC
jgi:hypothetical protein